MSSPVRLPFRSYIIVFGDNLEQSVTKTLWSHLAGQDIAVVSLNDRTELEEKAPDALLVFVILSDEKDPRAGLAQLLGRRDIVCHVTALVRDASFEQRMAILAHGFDSIFNLDFIQDKTFRRILLNHVEKGRVRLGNRVNHEEYEKIRAALSFSTAALIVLDDKKRLMFVSDHYAKTYPGWGHKLTRGMPVEDAFALFCREEDFAETDPRHEGLKRFWTHLEGEYDFHEKGGRILRLTARHLPHGQGTIVIVTNPTRVAKQQLELERKSAELSEALAKEREAGAIQKQFISMVSHEFRTPLTVIDGHAQIIERRGQTLEPENLQKRARTIRNAVSRLVLMMEGVLSSNMLQTGKMTLAPETLDLRRIVEDLCDEHRDLAANCQIETDIGRLPEMVRLDKKVCLLVLSNLLTNAVKFSKEAPRITVQGWTEGKNILLSVSDQGIGIPEKEISHVFDRYYRATTAGSVPGTGLGLSLARDLVQLHRGSISIESHEGRGTIVTFSLPLADAPR